MKIDYEPQENEEVKEIFPVEMPFVFELSKEECHLKFTGVCSLNRWFPYKTKTIDGDANYRHCRDILKSIKKDGITELIDVINYSCGHYGFNDGQHRTCIAKRKGIILKAIITTENNLCAVCRGNVDADTEVR